GDQVLVFLLGGYQTGGACYGFSSDPKDPWKATVAGEIRKGPYYDFKLNRLKSVAHTSGSSALCYLDVYGTPFAFFGSYGASNNYNANDCTTIGAKPYMQSATEYIKPESFQIISAGPNKKFGPGGLYNPATIAATDGRDDVSNFATSNLGSSN
ncbi:MAG: hypothetical protein K2R98_30385, partial [Gemmataceae bacterium]|nr:hypothetical protein [Gemmataceae bacterium]